MISSQEGRAAQFTRSVCKAGIESSSAVLYDFAFKALDKADLTEHIRKNPHELEQLLKQEKQFYSNNARALEFFQPLHRLVAAELTRIELERIINPEIRD